MPLQVGETLHSRYQIDQVLGEGSFGYVYQATDLALGHRVAIKELRPELAYDSEAFERFKREAEAARAIEHPHIVAGYGMEESDGNYYIMMEYVEGGNLADLLAARQALLPEEAIYIVMAVLDALAAIHQHGIVHRDIKPSNILFGDGGCPKLGDFGIARIPIRGEQSLTHAGTVIGTVNYMSPEQARGQKVDARSDLYGVGALMYEMLAGHPYLNFTKAFFRNLELIKSQAPQPLPPHVPRPIADVIRRALSKSRDDRFQSASEMRAALGRAGRGIGFEQSPAAAPERLGEPRRMLVWLAVAGAAALALCSAATVVLFVLLRMR